MSEHTSSNSALVRVDGVGKIFRRGLSRDPQPRELAVVRREFDRTLERYRANSGDAAKYLANTTAATCDAKQQAELAAFAVTATMIQNLDEAITHE